MYVRQDSQDPRGSIQCSPIQNDACSCRVLEAGKFLAFMQEENVRLAVFSVTIRLEISAGSHLIHEMRDFAQAVPERRHSCQNRARLRTRARVRASVCRHRFRLRVRVGEALRGNPRGKPSE